MGLGDFFRRRRQRESAIPASSSEVEPLGSFASSEGRPVVGSQVGGGAPDLAGMPGVAESLQALSALGPMIQQAVQQGQVETNADGSFKVTAGNVEIEQAAPQTLDMRGTDLGEEIRSIMKSHGIDPEGGASANIDASSLPGMQAEILAALARHGIDAGAGGSAVDLQIQPGDESN